MATPKKGGGLLAIAMGPMKKGKDAMADSGEESDEPNEGQKAAAARLADLLGVDDPDELASALKDFYDNC